MGNRSGKPATVGSVTSRSESSCRSSSVSSSDFWDDVFRGRRASTTDGLERPKLSVSDNLRKSSAIQRTQNAVQERRKESSVVDYKTYRLDNSVLKPEPAYHNMYGHHMHHYGGLCALSMANDPDECWILL